LFEGVRRYAREYGVGDLAPYGELASAVLAERDGDAAEAVRLLAEVDRALRERGQVLDPDDAEVREALRARLVTTLGEEGCSTES
jgi:hypothetical protein